MHTELSPMTSLLLFIFLTSPNVGSAGDQNSLTQKSYLIWYWNKQTETATPSQCFSYPKRPQLSQSILPN
ncbi:hypothetical protein ACJW31_12G031100 [Castanea mollissima]